MRTIRLSGREATVVRAIGFTDAVLGADIQDVTHLDPEDVTDVVNSLISAGFVESIPYTEQVDQAQLPTMSFEINPAYANQLRGAIQR